jgi:uncharacterized protein YukE
MIESARMRTALLVLATAATALAAGAPASAATGPVAASRPTITGTLQQGKKLVGSPGTWTGSGTISYAYQWYRCNPNGAKCSSIHGSTKATYIQVAKDVGQTVALTVRATDSTGTTAAYSSLAGLVTAAGKPVATAQPPLTGDPIAGQPLKVEAASWSAPPSATTYAWERCNANGRICAPIATATADTYTIAAGDVGHVLLAAVTATVAGAPQTVLSLESGLARSAPGPVAATPPSIAGTLQQGKQLTGNAGAWAGSGAISYAYQWYRCDAKGAKCSSVHGATRATYTQVAADVDHTVALTVRATDSTGTTPAYSSLAGLVAPTAATFAATAQPTLSGGRGVGQVLKVTGGTFTATPSSATYAWLQCNPNGRLCAPIASATTDSYTPMATDSGHTIVAVVTAVSGSATQAVLSTAVLIP